MEEEKKGGGIEQSVSGVMWLCRKRKHTPGKKKGGRKVKQRKRTITKKGGPRE